MRSFRIGAFLVLIVLVGAVAAVAYNLGVSAGLSDAAVAAGATIVHAPAAISPLGIIVGGFFLLLFLGFLARAMAGPPHAWRRGGWAYGHDRHWDGETVPEPFRPVLERWHREAHGGGSSAAGPASTGGGTPPPAWRPPVGPPPPNQPPPGA